MIRAMVCFSIILGPVAASDLPQEKDVLRQVGLFDDRVLPQQTHQLLFRHDLPVTLDQRGQQLGGLRESGTAFPSRNSARQRTYVEECGNSKVSLSTAKSLIVFAPFALFVDSLASFIADIVFYKVGPRAEIVTYLFTL